MSQKKHIILIDDDKIYCRALKKEAKKYHLIIEYYHNLEQGIEALENNSELKAVILDGYCPVSEGQDPKTAKSNFVFHALHRLTDIEHIHNRFVPYCVNTLNIKDFEDDLDGITQVFEKNKDHIKMFKFMTDKIEQLPETQIKNQHKEVFDFFEEYFSPEDEQLLIDLLQEMQDVDFGVMVSKLTILRRLEERLFDIVAVNFLGENPMRISTRNMSRTKNIIVRLKNQRKMPLYLFDFAMDIYSLSSRYGVHSSFLTKRDFHPTKYTVNSLIFAFLELCVWANKLID